MKLSIKKKPLFDIFSLLFYLVFFGFLFKEFKLFGITITSPIPVSLSILLYPFFQKIIYLISIHKYRYIVLWLSIAGFILLILMIFFLSVVIIKLFSKINITNSNVFKKTKELLELSFNVKSKYIMLFLFTISLVVRLVYINDGLFHHDSVQIALATEKTLTTGHLQSAVGERYGLVLINSIIFLIPHFIFGVESSEFIVNFASALFGSLAVLMLYLFMKELFNNNFIAVSSSLLLSFNPLFLSVSTFAKDHSYALFFILLAGYSLVKAIKTDSNIYKVIFGSSSGFLLLVRISDIISLLPFALIYLFSHKFLENDNIKLKDKYSAKNIIFLLGPFLLITILFFSLKFNAVVNLFVSNKFLQTKIGWPQELYTLIIMLAPLGSFLLMYGLFYLIKNKKFVMSFFLIGWLILIFVFYNSFLSAKTRFFVPLLVPMIILIAISLDVFREKYTTIISSLMLIISLISMLLFIQPVLAYRHNYSSGKELVNYMSNIADNNTLIVDYGDNLVFYDYYGKGLNVIGCPLTDDKDEFIRQISIIHEALIKGKNVYLNEICFVSAPLNQTSLLYGTLTKNYELVGISDIMVDSYESPIKLDNQNYKIYRIKMKNWQ